MLLVAGDAGDGDDYEGRKIEYSTLIKRLMSLKCRI
jgi:hypothetical protein